MMQLAFKQIPKVQSLLRFSQRNFPRGVYKEQQWEKESKYKFRNPHPEKELEFKHAKSRKEIEMLKEGERQYQKFQLETGAQDQEQEKEIDRLLDERIAQGMDDEQILQEILQGHPSPHSTNDIEKLEFEKEQDILKKMMESGERPIQDTDLFLESGEQFEDWQQKAGKMLYEEDQILIEQWKREEKERRLKERQKSILQTTKDKRTIEPEPTFGYVKETLDVKHLHKNTMDQKMLDSIENEETQFDEQEFEKMKKRREKLLQSKNRLKSEVDKASELNEKDKDFMEMVERDDKERQEIKKEKESKEDQQIIGKQARTKLENDILPEDKKQMTTEQKIKKELAYVTKALDLDERGQKHWYYQLKREYEQEERDKKRMEQKKAQKEFRKLMNDYKLPKVLQDEEDYDQFYNSEEGAKSQTEELKDEVQIFQDAKEQIFYNDDINFMKYHKRTTNNIHTTLQDILNSQKQIMYQGVKSKYMLTINSLKLNKACSVVDAFWSINKIDLLETDNPIYIQEQLQQQSQEIENYKLLQAQIAVQENKDLKVHEVKEELDKRSPVQYLKLLEREKESKIEAEIQKRLVKATPFIRSKLTQILGLRYAPEVRFYKDNTIEMFKDYQQEAMKILEDQKKQDQEKLGIDPQLEAMKARIQLFKKMDYYQRKIYIMNAQSQREREILQNLLKDESLAQAEEQVDQAMQAKKREKEALKENNKANQDLKPTRRGIRALKELDKWKTKVNEAGQTNFDELSEKPMNPSEIEESLFALLGTISPTKHGIDEQTSKKYRFDEEGNKHRLPRSGNKKIDTTNKSERKQRKATNFWNSLEA